MNEETKTTKELTIDKIVNLEWKQFQAVQNQGGRASCQDNWKTFEIMRKSQFFAWDEEVVDSYYQDLLLAELAHWNMLTEKYARMMESTAPAEYEALKDILPGRTQERLGLQEKIIKMNIRWEEEFAARYPNIAGRGRCIHTYEDTPWSTSMETYIRGELGTYSNGTVEKYYDMCLRMEREGESLTEKTMYEMIRFYGYETLEAAEESHK